MTVVTDAAVPVLPVETPEFAADPEFYLEAARREHPWLARFSQGYLVHGCQAAAELLADDNNLRTGFGPVVDFYGLRGTMWGRFMTEIIMAQSGDTHRRLRASINPAFTPRRANAARELIRDIVSDLLDEWAPRGAFDFAEFAACIPISVVCGLLGVSTEEIPRLRSALENQLLAVTLDPAAKPLFLAGWEELWEFADRLVQDREASSAVHSEGLLDALILAKRSGQIDEVELRFMVLTMIVGGYDTTKNQLSVTMKLIMERPEVYARCGEDLQFCGRAVDEALRHTSTVSPYRAVAHDFIYRGVQFRKGETLVLGLPVAGRDPEAFAEPLMFDAARPNASRHIAFGRGGHICPGQFVAKNLMQETMHLVAQRLHAPRLMGPVEWRTFLGAYGLKQLPIRFELT